MNTRVQLAIAAVAFALGAWCARPSTSDAARPQFRDASIPSVPRTEAVDTIASKKPAPTDAVDSVLLSAERWSAFLSCVHEPAYFRRRAEMAEKLGDATSAEIADYIARAEKLPGKFQDMVLYSLVSHWFEVDASAAAKWVRERWNMSFLPIWAAHDRTAALSTFIEQRPKDRYMWEIGGIGRIAGDTPAEQVTTLAELPPSTARDELIARSLAKWAQLEPEAAWARASQLPASAAIAQVQKALLTGGYSPTQIDPARHLPLATKFATEARPGLNGDTFATQFAALLAAQDPGTARQWIGSLPDVLRPAATLGVAREWSKKDAVAALEWTRAQGHDIARNLYTEHTHATGTVLSQAMASHPARTATWLLAQPAGEQRDAWIETAAVAGIERLSGEEREKAARRWLRELHTAMPEESRARLAAKLGAQAALLR